MAYNPNKISPAVRDIAVDISGGDQTLSEACRAIYVGGAGNIALRLAGATADSTYAVTAGSTIPISVKIFRQTGTTATGVKALY